MICESSNTRDERKLRIVRQITKFLRRFLIGSSAAGILGSTLSRGRFANGFMISLIGGRLTGTTAEAIGGAISESVVVAALVLERVTLISSASEDPGGGAREDTRNGARGGRLLEVVGTCDGMICLGGDDLGIKMSRSAKRLLAGQSAERTLGLGEHSSRPH